MSGRISPPATLVFAAAIAAAMLTAASVHAASLTVREADGSQWTVTEDPAEDAQDDLLKHAGPDGTLDPRFGRGGRTPFTLDAASDPPASMRVDATRRIWMVGASVAGNQPQPVVARFLPDGSPDLRWGVQGKVQASPGGLAITPTDLLPLSDGSVLVAGDVVVASGSRATLFHLKADGALDASFGSHGIWQRPGDDEASTAASLAAGNDGGVVVAVALRGARAAAELWSLNDAPPKIVLRKPLDDSADGEDLRATWFGDHWSLVASGGPTGIVPSASLASRPRAAAGVASAASDPGQGVFSPFGAAPVSTPTSSADADDGLSLTAIAVAAALIVVAAGFLFVRRRSPGTSASEPGRH